MSLRIGMGNSYGLRLTVFAAPSFDPSTVTGATIKVTKPNGTKIEWAATLDDQSALSVQARYDLAATGLDIDMVGTWRAWVQWTVPGQTPGPRTETTSFQVIAADS